MKTPVYRVVNAADGVTMVPPAAATISGLAYLGGFIPLVGPKVKSTLNDKFGRYLHSGDMRYLTNVKNAVNLSFSIEVLQEKSVGARQYGISWQRIRLRHTARGYWERWSTFDSPLLSSPDWLPSMISAKEPNTSCPPG